MLRSKTGVFKSYISFFSSQFMRLSGIPPPGSAMADKKYLDHGHKTPFYAKICRITAVLPVSPVHVEKDKILQKTAQFSPL